jgi:V/A-type H+-transporting ATPase subunit K
MAIEQGIAYMGYAIGAGLAVGLAGLGSGIAEKDIGAAAVGAMAEDQKNFGKGLILTVIPETIVIFGLVMAILLWTNIKPF